MTKKLETKGLAGVLARLGKDQSGNTLALTAAAMIPLLGMVGGAVDMSRTYAVKSKLQSACDAGVLAGLKVVSGNWIETNNDVAEAAALTMFNANFKPGSWGAENVAPTFSVDEKMATADVPMTIMQVFGREKTTVSVECAGELQLPNADIMFVLDVTGSMGDPIPGDPSGTLKINGLKVGVNCFYEILAREDNPDVTDEQCDYESGEEPWADEVDPAIQLRFGFVPYSQMVNVGKLLAPTDFVDVADYQTRVPNITNTHSWTAGTTSTTWANNWTPATTPTSYNTIQSTSGWSDQTSNASTQQGTMPFQRTATNSTVCNGFNNLPGSSNMLVALSESGGSVTTNIGTNFTPSPPVYPQASQSTNSNQSQNITVTQWRYIWEKRGSTTSCFLERRNHTQTYPRTQTGSTTRSLVWTPRQIVTNWTYRQYPVDVSGFKNGDQFNTSIQLPINESSSITGTLSGSTSSTTFRVLANRTINWDGCIEERQTYRVMDNNPSDDWNPIPETAYDMLFNLGTNESDDATRWRFALRDLSWGRTSSGNRTTASVVGNSSMSQNFGWACPAAARKLTEYKGNAQGFANYVDTLQPGGNTYHDIGLLWGARLLSSDGIFGTENRSTRNSGLIRRHMVFMTDGETFNNPTNYTSYGLDWYDRRQTNQASAPTQTLLEDNNDARSAALCREIKKTNSTNETTELWVIYYGVPDSDTATRLKTCASDSNHFIVASNTQVLIDAFKNIAKKIAELQLTS